MRPNTTDHRTPEDTVEVRSASGPEHLRQLESNDAVVGALLDIAEDRCAAGRYRSAIEWCRIAASFAMTNATGRLRSTRMERIIDLIAARALVPSAPVPDAEPPGRRRVLHVLTAAAEIGGLTRLAQRWIARDAGSVSSLALTRQRAVTPALAAAAARSGGWAVALGDTDALARAARLRTLAADADIVICHLQPDDPVVAVAFGAGYAGAPVAVFDHADHLFGIAPTRASQVVDFRPIGTLLSTRARGYAPGVVTELPLLVPAGDAVGDRASARRRLGVDDVDVLIVTVARAIKFHDTSIRPTFADLVRTAMEADPRITLCVVGATEHDEPWPRLRSRYPGRIHAVGPTPDPHAYLAAADIYLDPFPFSSLTSLLEASAVGLPVLSYDGHRGLTAALGIADFVADDEDRPRSIGAFADRIRALAVDAGMRRLAGARARETFRALAPETAWRSRLEELYHRMQRAEGRAALGATPAPDPDQDMTDYGSALLAVEQRIPLLWTISAGIPHLDRRDRLRWRARTLAFRLARKALRNAQLPDALLLRRGGTTS